MQSYGFSDAEMSSALNGFSQVFNSIKLVINFPLLPLQQLKQGGYLSLLSTCSRVWLWLDGGVSCEWEMFWAEQSHTWMCQSRAQSLGRSLRAQCSTVPGSSADSLQCHCWSFTFCKEGSFVFKTVWATPAFRKFSVLFLKSCSSLIQNHSTSSEHYKGSGSQVE